MSAPPLRGTIESIIAQARREGLFDEWIQRYYDFLEKEGLIRDYSGAVSRAIEKSGILPSDTSTPMTAHKKEQKFAELNVLVEKQSIVADASTRALDLIRKNHAFRAMLTKDIEKVRSGQPESRDRDLKRSREYDHSDDRSAKRPRDSRV